MAVVLLTAGAAFAATTYDNQSDFLSHVESGYYLESFGAPAESELSPPGFTDGTYAWNVASLDDLYVWGEDVAGGTPCVGTVGTNSAGYDVTITFVGAPVTAFGGSFYVTNVVFGAVEGDLTVALNDGTSVVLDSPYTSAFTGFTSDIPITSVTLSPEPDAGLFVTLDDVVVGTTIPEPASLGLLAVGALTLLRRR
ncbi:MAG: PEP-CTERM sorting domain-containing protein [Phycisphaerae bacterium]|jgi:hypothetical protein